MEGKGFKPKLDSEEAGEVRLGGEDVLGVGELMGIIR